MFDIFWSTLWHLKYFIEITKVGPMELEGIYIYWREAINKLFGIKWIWNISYINRKKDQEWFTRPTAYFTPSIIDKVYLTRRVNNKNRVQDILYMLLKVH